MNRTRTLALLIILLIVSAILTQVVGAVLAPAPLQVNGNSTNVNVLPANLYWSRVYGGKQDDRAFDAVTTDNGFLIVGSSKSIVPNTIVGWALRLDNDGNAVWNRTFLEAAGTELRFAINLTDGFLLVGNEFLPSGITNGYVAKIDTYGNIVWKTIIGQNQTDELYSAFSTQDGYVLLGFASSDGGAQSAAWVIKIDLNGGVVWNKTYTPTSDTVAKAGVLSPDGDYIVAGYTNSRFNRQL